MVCASSAPPVAGPATISACSMNSAGITSIRSCATRQIVDGHWNSWCGFEIQLAVEAVAVIEMAVHHDLEAAHVVERAGADLVVTSVPARFIVSIHRRGLDRTPTGRRRWSRRRRP